MKSAQDPILCTKKIYLLQRGKGQEVKCKMTKTGKKRQATKKERKGMRENGNGMGVLGEELPLYRKKTDMAHRKMVVYKGKGETLY